MSKSNFDYQGLPPEIQKLLEEIHKDMYIALRTNKEDNYGLSREWIEAAMQKLPQDNGLYNTWPEAERRLEG